MLAKAEGNGFGSTARTRMLKANRVYPGIADEVLAYTKEERTPGQVDYLKELKTHIRTYSKICPERARYWTRGYRESDGEPEVIRVANAVASVLDNMTIYIEPGELIVGNYASSPVAMPIYQEYFIDWLPDAIGPQGMYEDRVNDEERKELLEIAEYWKGNALGDRIRAQCGPELEIYKEFNGVTCTIEVLESHAAVTSGFRRLIKYGANGIIKKCKDRLKEVLEEGPKLNATGSGKTATTQEYVDKIANLNAMIIANEAFVRFGKHYSKLALEMAAKEKDSERVKELKKISEVCGRVPAEPPRTLHEAFQTFFLFHMLQAVVTSRCYGSVVRFDVLFNPFLQKDLTDGRITREEALELIECLWVKVEGISSIRPPQAEALSVGSTQYQTFTLGGVLENGEDAINEMSYLALEASMNVHTIQPTLVVRYHTDIDPKFIDKCIDCIRSGLGFPAFLSDAQAFPMFVRQGVPEDQIWDWTCPSCVSRTMPDANMRQGYAANTYFSYGKCLDLALNDGYDRWLDIQLGPHTGDPTIFKSIEDVKKAYLNQVEYHMERAMKIIYIAEEIRCRYIKRPLVSPYLDECIERGMTTTDFAAYGTYNCPEIQTPGGVNVGDSLTVLKKLVFDENKVTMKELLDAMLNNWEGKEDLRQMCLAVPKFGNDNDEADQMARWVQHESQEVLGKFTDYWGAQVRSQGAITSGYYSYGRACPATPEGRVDSEPFADGSISPMAGRDTRGPTATMKSVSKVDPQMANELLLNQKFMPQFLEEENKKLFADYLKTWYDLDCWHVQFNVVDKDVLLDAQKHPENYPDLVVRVAGYSSYWVDLGKPM
ncbi:MAG: hypothetical protein JRJ20_08880, partial [Deltaproteobacteria bacterium]|nr:hypothetical protein [Deltaproteobacteria bacterium]